MRHPIAGDGTIGPSMIDVSDLRYSYRNSGATAVRGLALERGHDSDRPGVRHRDGHRGHSPAASREPGGRSWPRPSRHRTGTGAGYPSHVDRDEIVRVLRAFEAEALEYVLIGATAMGFHGVVRATEDVDLFIRATPDNVERLRSAFRKAYDSDPHIEQISAADLLGDYPALRYYPPTGDLYFDVMTRLGDAASFETVDREVKEIDGTRVSVATPAALYRLKKGTVRAKDRQDAAMLRERFHLSEED
jgi:hypothetical protein